MDVIVYNKKTGKPVTIPGVDAKEYVKSGGWSYEDPKDENPTQKKSGGTYASESAAKAAMTRANVTEETHEIKPVDKGGFIIEKKTE